ncbi:hypothetical protein NH14_031230 [Paraburkholderia sacchari]|uniref:Uncharacterized protein n=2 Tax=Paraburkholderia sacchari TaxID=159450 RepID=A0A8T6ZLR8_9BURK|nr:hypothetical protein [Paraburkholderia sacchari]
MSVKMVRIKDFPQLRFIAWNRPGDDVLSDEDAFALYERNWRFVDQKALDGRERALIERLTNEVGHGHLHV